MRNASRFVGVALFAAVSVSCGDVVRQGKSPVFLSVDSIQATPGGGGGGTGSSVLLSDVQRLIFAPAPCSTTSPCPTIFNDLGTATFSVVPKDVTGPAPTSNNDVTITGYHVTYRRADGRNTPGVDVPFPFDGAVTVLVAAGSSASTSFELVRHVAKQESPLAQLANSPTIITTFAEVTFYGKDRVGNDISVTGTIQVNFGNFADA
jgi:hypothetical protein